jgi:maleylpyruvate isomerase
MRDDLEALHRSDQRVVRTVDSLTDEQWAAPSILPGWTRAHVVAHLALNAECFARALAGLAEGEMVPIYDSNESRDAGIEELALAPYGEIRERFFAATQHFRNVADELEDEAWSGTVLRLPTGPEWPAAALVGSRRREVEIHHADLDAGYGHHDWPADFCADLLERESDSPVSPGFTVHATDLDRSWSLGGAEPVISGTAAELGWWLVGRGSGDGLTGDLPQL